MKFLRAITLRSALCAFGYLKQLPNLGFANTSWQS